MKHRCDGCDKLRSDVRSVGKDSNGEPDAPDFCFLCRKENQRGRHWNSKVEGYVPNHLDSDDLRMDEAIADIAIDEESPIRTVSRKTK